MMRSFPHLTSMTVRLSLTTACLWLVGTSLAAQTTPVLAPVPALTAQPQSTQAPTFLPEGLTAAPPVPLRPHPCEATRQPRNGPRAGAPLCSPSLRPAPAPYYPSVSPSTVERIAGL